MATAKSKVVGANYGNEDLISRESMTVGNGTGRSQSSLKPSIEICASLGTDSNGKYNLVGDTTNVALAILVSDEDFLLLRTDDTIVRATNV